MMFVAEKGLVIPTRSIDSTSDFLRSPEFLAKNPLGQIPLLEGPDGFSLSESMAICRYLDERYPEPTLFGEGPEDRARIHMWARRIEFQLFLPAVELGHHTHPLFRDHFDQTPDDARLCLDSIVRAFGILDAQLRVTPFVAGNRFSVADIVSFCGIQLATLWRCDPPASHTHLRRWREEIDSRPTAAIARYRDA